jgi:hypothetical protein
MSTNSGESGVRGWVTGRRWSVFVLAVVLAAGLSMVFGLHGDVLMAVIGPVLLVGYAVGLLVFARRSETAALLSDQRADERRKQIQLYAGAASFNVLVLVLVGGFVVQLARGQESGPFMWLGTIAGVAYIVAVVFFSRRG